MESTNSKNYQSNKPQINENIQESHSSNIEKPQTSTHPHKAAARKARSLVTEWSKNLEALEDVMD